MQIITMMNEKGGVGKTTAAAHLAAGLANKDKNVLLIDADPQAHATLTTGMKAAPGLYDVLVRDAGWNDAIVRVPDEHYLTDKGEGNLYLVPANVEIRSIPLLINNAFKLDTRLQQLSNVVDVVIFDTPPTPSLLHASILFATDWILFPTMCEYLSFDGLVKSLAHKTETDKQREEMGADPIQTMDILPTMYRGGTLEHKDNLLTIREKYGDKVWEPMTEAIVWGEATRAKRPVFLYAPGTTAAKQALAMVDRANDLLSAQ